MSKGASKETSKRKPSRYASIIERIFINHHKEGITEFVFERDEIAEASLALKIKLPANLGDVLYSTRYRSDLPPTIRKAAKDGKEWIITGAGTSRYRFKMVPIVRIVPQESYFTIKVPDATPEIISAYALLDEQSLLAKVRYSRLVDLFLGITAYSLQNHLRSTVKEIGQIEIDEIYVGVDRYGRHFVVPVQAKGGNDRHAVVQTEQDIAYCRQKFPQLICRAISAQFMKDNRIAMFELTLQDDVVRIVDEKHYLLVPKSEITGSDLEMYSSLAPS